MMKGRNQAGDSKIGCILWALLLAIGVLIAWKAIPVKIASSELYDYMVEQAKWAGGAPADVIQRRVYNKAIELGLPVDIKNVKVEKPGDNVKMRAVFTVPLEFPGYTYEWNFDFQVNRAIYIF
jgi:hypothetical protein